MNTNEQSLWLAGCQGELSTVEIIDNQMMTPGEINDIVTIATASFAAENDMNTYRTAVDGIMAFRVWLQDGKFHYNRQSISIGAISLCLSFKVGDNATLEVGATGVIPDGMETADGYVSLYDQVTAAYNSFRRSRVVGSPATKGNDTDTQGQPNNPTSEIIDCTAIRVEERNGKTYYRAVGGRWTKFGVVAWPEAMDTLGMDWKRYPSGDNPVHIKAELQLGADGKPQKVTRFITT